MASNDALDLSQIDPPVWRIKVGDVVYGPYTLGQMRAFIEEGRITAGSSVARGDDGMFVTAGAYMDLVSEFSHAPPPSKEEKPAPSNFVVTIKADGDGRRGAISVLNEVGRFSELMTGTFILNAEITAYDLRAQLATVLAERGKFIIVNADTGQLAWMGLGSDADEHARAVWKRGD